MRFGVFDLIWLTDWKQRMEWGWEKQSFQSPSCVSLWTTLSRHKLDIPGLFLFSIAASLSIRKLQSEYTKLSENLCVYKDTVNIYPVIECYSGAAVECLIPNFARFSR